MDHLKIKTVAQQRGSDSAPLFVAHLVGDESGLAEAARRGAISRDVHESLAADRRVKLVGNIHLAVCAGERRVCSLEVTKGTSCVRTEVAPEGPLGGFFQPPPMADRYRLAGAELAGYLRQADLREVGALVVARNAEDVGAFVEGMLLAAYSYERFLAARKKPEVTRQITLSATVPPSDVAREFRRAEVVAQAVNWARDLINTPARELGPEEFEEAALKLARSLQLKTRVLRLADLDREGMGALMAVGQGSPRQPRLVVLEYRPARPALCVALVGKGITFDSGGLSLKDGKGMELMKKDMAGAAVVVAVMKAASALELPVHLVAITPLAENMPDGRAQRPGDIVTTCLGKTVEVLNTDAEGRLILADAMTYAGRYRPDVMVDVATLTGEAGRTFANVLSPVLGNDWTLVSRIVESGLAVHERFWPLPILPEYRDALHGDICDLKNSAQVAGCTAGSIVGASFLSEFAGDIPWAHLDIANTSYSGSDVGYFRKGATGVGVRVLVNFLQTLCAAASAAGGPGARPARGEPQAPRDPARERAASRSGRRARRGR